MYASGNPKSKAELKRLTAVHTPPMASARPVHVFSPGLGNIPPGGGKVYLEGPHYPAPHTWYASAMVDADGFIIPGSVK